MIGGEVIVEKNPSTKYCVARKELLCDSIIWDMLQNYYKKATINAWKENVVPSFVTSNSKLAKDYARVIVNYMKDYFNSSECDRNVPIYILEIGAGHGKFTYLILRALSKYKKFFKSMNIPERAFVYVFTDIAKDNINYCMNNERLKKYINTGDSYDQTYVSKNNSYYDSEYEKNELIKNYDSSTNSSNYSSSYNETNYSDEKVKNYSNFSMLDFAFFDGNETSDKIYLEVAKKYVPSNTPIVLICNYVLDSLLTDAWIVNGTNSFKRALLSVYSPKEEEDKTNADIMLRMSVTWDWIDINIDNEIKKEKTSKPSDYLRKYEDIYTVLKLYSYFNQDLSFVLPVGAFILFKRILKLSNNKLLCLIGDKGYQSYEEFRGYRDPHIVVHGSLSFMVNLNAICLFFLSLGGYYIYTPYSDTFQIVTLLMHPKGNVHVQKSNIETSTGAVMTNSCGGRGSGTAAKGANASSGGASDPSCSPSHYNSLAEQLDDNTTKKKRDPYIIEYFKKNSKDYLKSRYYKDKCNNLTSTMTKSSKCVSANYTKYCANSEKVYRKMKKMNLKNLNDMTIKFGGTITSFSDNVEQFPPDLLISWQKSVIHNINNNTSNVNIKELISLLRYSNYDSDVFFNIRKSFTNLASYPNINGRTEKDILLDIKECYDNYYSLKNDEDIADACGHMCMKFGKFEKAIFYLKESLRNFKNSRHSSTYINIASCYKVLGNYRKSLKFIRSAIKLSKKEKKRKSYPSNNISHSYDLLYSIQLCSNPITYAIIGLGYYIQNDGLYFLSFENRIKLKYIILLSKEEERVLKFMNTKFKHSDYDRTSKHVDLSQIKVIKMYEGNRVYSLEHFGFLDYPTNNHMDSPSEDKVEPGLETTSSLTEGVGEVVVEKLGGNVNKIPNCYPRAEELKTNLVEILEKHTFEFCVIDAPWVIKADIAELMLDKSRHIFTYGTLADTSKRSLEVISKYNEVAKQISWVNNNYINDECLYEAREALNYIKDITSITVTHYSMNVYNNQNECIACRDILTDDLCCILNILQVVLSFNLTGITANFSKGENLPSGNANKGEKVHIGVEANADAEAEADVGAKGNNPIEQYVCLSGIIMFTQNKSVSEERNIYGNYLLMNNKNEEFVTSISIVGMLGCLCLKKTLSNWSIHVFNINNEKIFDKSGRIAASQNANDVFINQYLIKTNGRNNNIKHINEYDLKGSCKGSSESIDSDIDILEFSSSDDDHDDNENYLEQDVEKEKTKKEYDKMRSKEVNISHHKENDCDNLFMDRNLEILKNIPGKRFYSIGKDVYENINLDENFVDITVNNICFYSRIVEGINMSYKKGGMMINFKYNVV
ncbi:hypothetical protein MKS88_003762 [Plasmodium brasilianum]|uniref:Uncharacterized protein n=1 Tax=Plasmodium brasilianum TaxID=5824 RepID=A0ACB9Y8X8_PLABR|nr:hypothetical protein MKS88_003762 [Plasmodium brasilianum]